MARLTRADKAWLVRTFGPRAVVEPDAKTQSRPECLSLPRLFKILMGNTVLQPVVYPENEAEVLELARWAARGKIALFPRGGGSSRSGASVPADMGCIIDFSRMRRLLAVDSETQTATVEPGINWGSLERELSLKGLALRLIPARGPLSTAGGSVAQASYGEGSWEFGGMADAVVRVRLALPGGSVKELSGENLELVCGAEGTTGLITEITLRARRFEIMEHAAAAFPEAGLLGTFFSACLSRRLPLWSAGFMNSEALAFRGATCRPEEDAGPADRPRLNHAGSPAFAAVLSFRREDGPSVKAAVRELAAVSGGVGLDEIPGPWRIPFSGRIDLKKLRLAPIPVAIAVPLEKTGDVLNALESRISRLIIDRGFIVRRGKGGKPETAVFGQAFSARCVLSHHLAFGLVLTAVKIAEGQGGRALESGLLFTHRIDRILGKDRVSRMRDFKWDVDPGGILNPGKVFEESLVSRGLSQLGPGEIPIRMLGNTAVRRAAARIAGSRVNGDPS